MEARQYENSFRCSYIYPPGIMRFEIIDMAEIDIKEVDAMHAFSMEFTQGRQYATLFVAGPMLNISKEAREHGTNSKFHKGLVCQAIIINSLAHRILGNFIVRFNRGITETRLFSTEAEAIKWLEKKLI
ncbi:MAG: hypothetical protein ACHQF2_01555 [Flavobacteriales bacterium]